MFLTLAQRDKDQADRWASFKDNRQRDIIRYAKDKFKDNKYEAINLSNMNTIEFRFMKGNLYLDGFYKNIEIVLSAIEFSKNVSINNCNEDSYLKYIVDHKKDYKNLYDFALRSNLIRSYNSLVTL